MRRKNPCTKDCPNRKAGSKDHPPCHSYCKERADYLAEIKLEKAARAAQSPTAAYFHDRSARAFRIRMQKKVDWRKKP